MHIKRSLFVSLLAFAPALVLAGCGGGGGGGGSSSTSTNLGSISGKVVDTAGNPVAAAAIELDGVELYPTGTGTGTTAAGGATFSEGSYDIQSVQPGYHEVTINTTIGGVVETGSTQVGLGNYAGNNYTNLNIIVSPTTEQASVSGYVMANGKPVAGAVVYFNTAFNTAPSGVTTPTNVSIQAVTEANGYYQITDLPVQNTATSTARTYTVTAAYPTLSSTASFADATPVSETFTAGQTATDLNFSLPASGTDGTDTPALEFIQAFTQPDDPASSSAHVAVPSADSVYQQIREDLSPQYAALVSSEHPASEIKHLVSTEVPHAASNQYTAEMDLFFSLPGDTSTTPDPARAQLSGFDIYSDAQSSSNTLQPYDFLEDPLANVYVDPNVSGDQVYFADTAYQFAVQSVASNGITPLGESNTATAEPLSFVNLSQPLDPSDQNGTVSTLSSTGNFVWTTIDPNSPGTPNFRIANYTVFIYSSFPSIDTTPIYQSPTPIPGTTDSFPISSAGLTTGTEYWLVVAATASEEPTDSNTGSSTDTQAISVSQIVPFYVQ